MNSREFRWRSRGGVVILSLVAATFALAFAGCGGGGSSSGSAGTTAEVTAPAEGKSTTAAAGGDSIVAEAGAVAKMATSELVYSAVEVPTQTGQIEPYGSWRGPTKAPKAEAGVTVQVITCSKQAPGCTQPAEGAIEAAEELGWKAELIDGGGSPEGYARAFNTALTRHPDAIVAVAIPTIAVGDSLEKAKSANVYTLDIADLEPSSGPTFDAYVPYPTDAQAAIAAWSSISEADGAANQLLVRDSGWPVFQRSVQTYEKVIGQCSTCKSTTIDWQLSDAVNPAKVNELIGGAISQEPDLNGVFIPYGLALPNVTQAVASAGKSGEIAISSQLGESIELQSVAAGDSAFAVGTSGGWAGWAGIDQLNRGLSGEPLLKPTEIGLGVAEFTKQNAPASGDYDEWSGMIDYRSEYRKIWGVG